MKGANALGSHVSPGLFNSGDPALGIERERKALRRTPPPFLALLFVVGEPEKYITRAHTHIHTWEVEQPGKRNADAARKFRAGCWGGELQLGQREHRPR